MQPNHNLRLKVGFSNRKDGDLRSGALRNEFLRRTFGFEGEKLVTAQQVHGDGVAVVSARSRGKRVAKTDGLAYRASTATPIALGVRVADCAPILLVDEKSHVIAAVHAGWRGTLGGISMRAVDVMESLGAKRGQIRAVIGPHIKDCCYDVPPGRADAFVHAYPQVPSLIVKKGGKQYLSLIRALVHQLQLAGIKKDRIKDVSRCTASHNDEYFSYRADTQNSYGEQMGFIGYA
jgi:hypothetical protein